MYCVSGISDVLNLNFQRKNKFTQLSPQVRVLNDAPRACKASQAVLSRSLSKPRWGGRRNVQVQRASATENTIASEGSGPKDYFAADARPIILFDGVCNMCNGGVNFVLDWDPVGKVRFAALQSEAGRVLLARSGRSPDDISSIVLVEKDGFDIKSDAVLKIAQYLQLPIPAAAAFATLFPLVLRDGVYDQVAQNRYNIFGMSDACRLSDDRFAERFVE
mmetsp:Transcript_16759/g.32425  ORF Transcript_16759/g.32425 Transcript_16759/m.32425 type:complete len:219 (+) Transcript_16759:98-754(+)|eukprot:CAMPEP_0114261094 /NCGR_PEP_ID=MMETSP0058-20121206/20907_1 /TAXON_ID=36894 /ORGANISM="Pyramimonas parkeae, CCMP726" /LENGTH=218 /DNA_ID=CAMNT_0001376513 /DNA_START=67 /DNA_END=723 /DNA_ORIENTATION=-